MVSNFFTSTKLKKGIFIKIFLLSLFLMIFSSITFIEKPWWFEVVNIINLIVNFVPILFVMLLFKAGAIDIFWITIPVLLFVEVVWCYFLASSFAFFLEKIKN
jgi:hypothetical protein